MVVIAKIGVGDGMKYCRKCNRHKPFGAFYELVTTRDGRRGPCKECTRATHSRIVKSKGDRYYVWCGMRRRCNSPLDPDYPTYGGAGIAVCDAWDNYEQFCSDMGPRPSSLHSIDRYPDKDGDYEPSNCRWATAREQAENRRTTINLTHDGRTQCAQAWARELRIHPDTIRQRLRRGCTVSEALGPVLCPGRRRPGTSRGAKSKIFD